MSQQKKIKLAKTVTTYLVSALLLITVGFGGYYLITLPAKTQVVAKAERTGFEHLAERPLAPKIVSGAIPTGDALKAYAANLYQEGMKNANASPYCVTYGLADFSACFGSTKNLFSLDIVTMKTQYEYFRIDYRLKDDAPLLDELPVSISTAINESLGLVQTERQYYKKGMSAIAYQRVCNAAPDENRLASADWTQTITEESRDADGVLENGIVLTAHNVTASTIKSAEVSYDRSGGFYAVKIVLDCYAEGACEKANSDVAAGAGDRNAHYDTAEIDFEIWDNGYFKRMTIDEIWLAKAIGLINLTNTFHYDWKFSYDESDCDIGSYRDSRLFLDALAKE